MTERTGELPPDEPDEAPEGFREQPRYAPAVERAYANDRSCEGYMAPHAHDEMSGETDVVRRPSRRWT